MRRMRNAKRRLLDADKGPSLASGHGHVRAMDTRPLFRDPRPRRRRRLRLADKQGIPKQPCVLFGDPEFLTHLLRAMVLPARKLVVVWVLNPMQVARLRRRNYQPTRSTHGKE
ncbi:uncharacterized protein LOC110436243 isoform X2 [Sorghum bicolor]|nr:uncharacterized protein LOC110436243 isoform X2 [Sorghum bicolor]|eukprot:XP_021318432.1 uncharacterized protein LOC110436243 isoform X2 [Sorghum bicolor]